MKAEVHSLIPNIIRTKHVGDVLVIEIDNPPINAGSMAVRRGLIDAIETLQGNSDVGAAILIGAGNTFIAGSDLREFGKSLEYPQLPAVIAAIEDCGKPVVAALHGAALGGGFELALGCDARIALRNTVVGLPEVTLGIIPGAGGTQRLPRRVGVARAIQMICSGERIPAGEAQALKLIDEVVDVDLQAAAIAYARRLMGHKCRIRDEAVPNEEAALIDALRSRYLGGAVLDVFDREPLDPKSPLWTLPNVIISPHSSGVRPDHWNHVIDLFADNLRRFQRGATLLNMVDSEAGY